MNRNVELALLAGASYESSRNRINKFPIPEGWTALNLADWPYGSQKEPQNNVPGRVYWQDSSTGFEAAAYVKGSAVAMSFAGTYFIGELDSLVNAPEKRAISALPASTKGNFLSCPSHRNTKRCKRQAKARRLHA